MKILLRLVVAVYVAGFLVSCKKHDIPTQSIYTFTNTTDQRITFNVYANKEDYNQNRNGLQQYFIESGASAKVSFDVLKTYWIDWYGDNLSFNNWRSDLDGTSPPATITIAAENDHYAISADVRDTSRSILLTNNGLSSKWHGAIYGAGALNGAYTFEFKKDFSGNYTFTDNTGGITTQAIRYTVLNRTSSNEGSSFVITVYDDQHDQFCMLYSNPASGAYCSGRDSMILTYSRWSFNQYFPLVRD